MRWRRAVAAAAGLVTVIALAAGAPAQAEPGESGAAGRMDSAVRAAAGLEPARSGRGEATPLRTDDEGRVVVYVEASATVDGAALRDAVAAAGGEVTGGGEHRVRAAVPPDRLQELAGTAGVLEVRRPETPVPMVVSEGVQPSGALAWHDTGRQGAGVKVGIIDVGFGRLEATQANGELPADVTVHDGSCGVEHGSTHGTTVAEVVHDMAPQAELYLACVADTIDFEAAGRWLAEQGVRVVNVSLAFPGTGRGDGVADLQQPDWSPATVVSWLRGQGIVVVAAAGNEAQRHWTGATVDPNQDGWVNISGNAQNLGFSVSPGGTVTVELKWDAWPVTNQDLDLYIMADAHAPTGPNDPDLVAVSQRAQLGTPGGLSPVELREFTDSGTGPLTYWVYVKTNGARTDLRYDLTMYGPVEGLSWNQPAGSIAEPASSPAVLAVGAITPENAAVGGDVTADSSRGPTIDGRIKPDLTGFAGVTTFTDATATGTSVSAAHVSGAAALYLGANPDLDPGELEALLLDSSTRPGRGNTFGYGVLHLGAARDPQPYSGDGYTPLQTPQRMMSFQRLAAGETVTVRGLPASATAVVLSVHGQDAAAVTNLQAFPDTPTGVDTVELVPGRSNQAAVAVTMHPRDRVVRVRTTAAAATVTVDLLGYFSPGGASSYFPLRNPVTLLDTRTWGTASPKLSNNEVQTIRVRGVAGVPSNATAAVVNVTAVDVASARTAFDLYADNQHTMGTLGAAPGERLTKFTIVPIGSDGAIRLRARGGETHAEVDLIGWFASGNGARYVPMLHTERIFDTASGTSVGAVRQFQTGNALPLRVALQPRVPATISAAWLAVRATTASAAPTTIGTWAIEYPWQGHHQLAAQRFADPRSTQTNSVLTPLGASGTAGLRNSLGATDLSVALQGYFVGAEPVAAGPIPDPTGFWRFDEAAGDTAADASGNGHTVTMQGDSGWVGGRVGAAAWLDGSTGFGTTAGPVLRTDQSFSVAAWVYKEGSSGAAVVGQDNSLASTFLLENIGGTAWSFSGVGSGSGGTSTVWRALDSQPTRRSEWTHLVGVYDAPAHQLRLYVNGALAGLSDGVTLPNATGPLTIGVGKSNGNRAGAFDGGIDDVRAYDRVLAESDIRRLHGQPRANNLSHWRLDETAGTIAADSGWMDNTGTLHGGVSRPPGVFGHAVMLDGTSGYVQTEFGGVFTKDNFSISAWVFLTDRGSRVVVAQDGRDMTPFHLQYSPGFDRWVLSGRVEDKPGAAGSPIALGARTPALGRWTHLVAVYDAGHRQFRLYVDGELEGVADGVTTWPTRGAFTIGRALNVEPTGFFKGAIDDVRTYQGLLTDEQIRALATR